MQDDDVPAAHSPEFEFFDSLHELSALKRFRGYGAGICIDDAQIGLLILENVANNPPLSFAVLLDERQSKFRFQDVADVLMQGQSLKKPRVGLITRFTFMLWEIGSFRFNIRQLAIARHKSTQVRVKKSITANGTQNYIPSSDSNFPSKLVLLFLSQIEFSNYKSKLILAFNTLSNYNRNDNAD